MKVFVAGGTGQVGRRAMVGLLAAGHQVSALARTEEKSALLRRTGAVPVLVSLFDPDALDRAVAGQDAVVNLATHIPVGSEAIRARSWREDDRIRTEGSRNLVDAALRHHVQRFVQEAVTFVYPDSGDSWITEQTVPEPNARSQAATMAATAQAARFSTRGGAGVLLRFGQFYGPDPTSRDIRTRARAGKPVVLGRADGWLSPVHPHDAGRAVVAALECPAGIYNVCEPPVRRSEWASAIGAAVGRGPATFYPALIQKLAGPRAEPLRRSLRVDSGAFTAATGWKPAHRSTHGGWAEDAE
ncbi:NAD-dependent epimerase/dehydratase family protein [Cryobacterium fucosi]|uniref:NAD(P)-dependent oxidoreductase n=1 Tax=Cryobacterium fucosi TaxID=1259157 RepID=A0A4R9AXN5_9MICO|nr:NAD(P)-dependent oxidoreductase [Cryobacterium fucosi]TFD72120.1 NAD(P)-dependent oxidoreductase [Cryobacterium fucosi]